MLANLRTWLLLLMLLPTCFARGDSLPLSASHDSLPLSASHDSLPLSSSMPLSASHDSLPLSSSTRVSAETSLFSTSPSWLQTLAFAPAVANLMFRQSGGDFAVVKWRTVPTFDRDFELLRVSQGVYQFGDAMLWLTSLSAALAYNTGFSADEHRKLYVLLQVLCMEEGISGLLKLLIDRPRPDRSDRGSFPSAHAAFTFAWASFVATDLYRQDYRWFFPYLVATFTAITRVGGRKHYLSDVVAGGLLGALIGYYFYDFNFDGRGRWRGIQHSSNWHIQPHLQLSARGQPQFALQASTQW